MPPPKRPFTTSSLTSTLKSTIASQPLLSNLTNIDKLSSQASSLAQKTPFFGNNNNQNQNHQHQQQQQQTLQHYNDNSGGGQQQGGVGGGPGMMRAGNSSSAAPKPPMASTPTVDLSHLTEEERLMIQSVMAKAEMADMGMPVDTSAPSRTNLPSHTSQVLSQQTLQQQQLSKQQQQSMNQQQHPQASQVNLAQQQQQMMNSGMNSNNDNASNFQNNTNNQQQQMTNQQQQAFNQQPAQMVAGYQNHSNNNSNNMQQQQQQQLANSNVGDLQHHQSNLGAKSNLDARTTSASLGEQAHQLVNSINSQFHLGGQTSQPQQQQQSSQHSQQQQRQMAGNMQQNVPQQQQQQQQQQRFQQATSLGSFDQQQAMLAGQNAGLSNQHRMQLTSDQIGPNNQQQQQAMMMMIDEQQQARIMQANNSSGLQQQQVDFGQQQVALNPNNLIHQQQQAQQQLTAYQQQQLANLAPNQLDMSISGENVVPMGVAGCLSQQAPMGVANQQSAALVDPSTLAMQQPFNAQSLAANQIAVGVSPNQVLAPTSLAYSATAAAQLQDPMRQQQQLLLLQQQQLQQQRQLQPPPTREQFHDPRSDIRFGPQVPVSAASNHFGDFEGAEHALSDQECQGGSSGNYHSRRRNDNSNRQLEHRQQSPSNRYNVVRRYDSVNEQHKPTAAAVSRQHNSMLDPFESSGSRTIQAYDLAQRSPQQNQQFAGRHTKSQRQLPQPNLHQVALAADRSLQSSSEQLHNNNQNTSTRPPRPEEQSMRHHHQRGARDREQATGRSGPHSTRRKSPPARATRERKHLVAGQMSPPYESGSELEEEGEDVDEEFVSEADLVATTSTSSKRKQAEAGSGAKKSQQQQQKDCSVANETSNIGDSTGANDKNSGALRLLSELKLNEQASQVMEQQQLLIKQSQELIKLQLEQQALSQEMKKTMNTAASSSTQQPEGNNSSSEQQAAAKSSGQLKVDDEQDPEDEFDARSQERAAQEQQKQFRRQESVKKAANNQDESNYPTGSQDATTGNSSRTRLESTSKKSTSFCDEQAIESDDFLEERPNRTSSRQPIVTNNSNDDESSEQQQQQQQHQQQQQQQQASTRKSRPIERGGIMQKRLVGNPSSSATQTICASPRYNRDLLQSPTDTTDSDIEPISQGNLRRQQRLNQQQHGGKLKSGALGGGVGVRRREPTGLPPSPLPVAAAIQLHQMQQQHFKHQLQQQQQSNSRSNLGTPGQSSRTANFMRSRSVTSSPNHHLERSGYLTDHNSGAGFNNRIRSTSPDTLSEFGGLRRQRKRLPEPPTNTVPITPSMVRKMIQAQRAGAGATPCKLLSSVNAQSTLLTNTHSAGRNLSGLSFDSHNAASGSAGGFMHSSAAKGASAINSSSSPAYNNHHYYNELLLGGSQQQHSSTANAVMTTAASPSASAVSNSRPDGLASSSLVGSSGAEREQHSLQLHRSAPPTTASHQHQQQQQQSSSLASADLNKFLSSTYGNSILRNNISDVKETPELDKLISNLDEYYGLDSSGASTTGNAPPTLTTNAARRHVRLAQPSATSGVADLLPDHHRLINAGGIGGGRNQAHHSLPFAASSSSNFASLVASPTRNIASQNYPYGSLAAATTSTPSKPLLYGSNTPANTNNNYYLRRGSEGEYNFGSSARFGSSSVSATNRPYRISTLDELRAGYNAGNNGGQNTSSISRNPLLTSASVAYLNGQNSASAASASYLNQHSSPIRQSRYSTLAAERMTREYPTTTTTTTTAASATNDPFATGPLGSLSSARLFDRPASSSATYRPSANSSKYSRLFHNPTGSFDAENLDYLSSAGGAASDQYLHNHHHHHHQHLHHLHQQPQQPQQQRYNSLAPETRTTSAAGGAGSSSLYDRYSSNETPSFQRTQAGIGGAFHQQNSLTNEFSEPHRRSYQHQQYNLLQQKSFDLDSRRHNQAYQQQQNSFCSRPIGASNALFGLEPRARSELRSNNQYIEPMIDLNAGYFTNDLSTRLAAGGSSSPLPASQTNTTSASHYLGQPATDYQMRLQQQHSVPFGGAHHHQQPEQLASSRLQQPNVTSSSLTNDAGAGSTSFAPLTKDDIINNGPKFNSIGYRFRTENQNKYVAQARTMSITCLQSRYPHPYKRILLSKNPKDRIGNGIGVRIIGGQPMPSLYDKVNRSIVTSGAFVTEVFQSSNVYFMGELHDGDQIIEWNGVNLCNRSNEEVQQILLSQFSDEEVEIVYLHQDKFSETYELLDGHEQAFNVSGNSNSNSNGPDPFEQFAEMNKSGHQTSIPARRRSCYADDVSGKGSIRRKISLTSIANMWK